MKTGTVRWYDPQKGYGFIDPTDKSEAVFVHFSSLQQEGFKCLEDGQRVRFEVEEGEEGPKARNVQIIDDEHTIPSAEECVEEAWSQKDEQLQTILRVASDAVDAYHEYLNGAAHRDDLYDIMRDLDKAIINHPDTDRTAFAHMTDEELLDEIEQYSVPNGIRKELKRRLP